MLLTLLFCVCGYAAENKDPRLVVISQKDLRQLIRRTPINSPKHAVITARSRASHLEEVAYEEYTSIWRKTPDNAFANLRRGIAALNYSDRIGFVERGKAGLTLQQEAALSVTVRSCLAKAAQLQPNSAPANVAYGFFLWQYDNKMDEGLALLRETAAFAPKDARVHANLGNIYSNKSGNAYNLGKAEEELRTAVRLDRTYAYPLSLLISLYTNEERYKDAQWAMKAYLKLSPPRAKADMQIYQTAIDAGLAKQKS